MGSRESARKINSRSGNVNNRSRKTGHKGKGRNKRKQTKGAKNKTNERNAQKYNITTEEHKHKEERTL